MHLHKGEVVGFARPESAGVVYIATTNELNIKETIDVIPRNWIPKRKWSLKSRALQKLQETYSENCEYSQNSQMQGATLKIPQILHETGESSQTLPSGSADSNSQPSQCAKGYSAEKASLWNIRKIRWTNGSVI